MSNGGIDTSTGVVALQALVKRGEAPPGPHGPHGLGQCALTPHEDHEALAAGDRRVEQVALQHEPGGRRVKLARLGGSCSLLMMTAGDSLVYH